MNKIESVRTYLQKHDIDALLVTSSFNLRYMTGFTGTSGLALITQEEAVFITDFRYTEQASEQVKGYEVIEQKQMAETEVSALLTKGNIKSLAFEENYVSFGKYQQYKNLFNVQLVPISGLMEDLRMIKTEEEVGILKKAAEIADQTFEHIITFIRPGMTEIEVANELEMHMRSLGATSSSFDIIVASGFRSALPHGVASDKIIESGELVTMDYGALYNGYISDITRTVAVGEISDELKEIYDTVLAAQKIGVEHIRPGMTGIEADALTRDYITEKGFGEYFGHSTGHGIGLEVHEQPSLSSKSETLLVPGMAVTVEPGIYIPSIGGCRIEDDLIVTENGNERLTTSTKELIIIQ